MKHGVIFIVGNKSFLTQKVRNQISDLMEKVQPKQFQPPSRLYSGSCYGPTIDDKNQLSRNSESFFVETGNLSYVEHVLSRYKKMKSYTVDKTRIIELLTISNRIANYLLIQGNLANHSLPQ